MIILICHDEIFGHDLINLQILLFSIKESF